MMTLDPRDRAELLDMFCHGNMARRAAAILIDEQALRIDQALEVIRASGGVDGAHHKAWVLDQVVRTLAGQDYPKWVADFCNGCEGPETYSWDEGVAP